MHEGKDSSWESFHNFYDVHCLEVRNSPLEEQQSLVQNIDVQQEWWINQDELRLLNDHSKTVFENTIYLQGSSALIEDDYNLPDIVELNINGDIMANNDYVTPSNLFTRITIYHNNQKKGLQNFYYSIFRPNSTAQQGKNMKQKSRKQKNIVLFEKLRMYQNATKITVITTKQTQITRSWKIQMPPL